MSVLLSEREAKVAADVLRTVMAYTSDEIDDQFRWSEQDLDAWETALAKCNSARPAR